MKGYKDINGTTKDQDIKNPFSEKMDMIFSELMVVLSLFLTGFGLYNLIFVSWTMFPITLVGLTFWGLGCIGLRRAWELGKKSMENSKR